MVTNASDGRLDRVFSALADPTRREILARLSLAESTVGELAEPFAISRPAISKHLDVLERAGLVVRIPEGRQSRCRFVGAPLFTAMEWMLAYRHFWTDQFDAMARHFDTFKEDR